MKFPIYLDNAATTPVAPEVLVAMLPYFTDFYGNPASIYSLGAASRDAVENARQSVATALNAAPEEIIFTSGGTESDNTAIRGVVQANRAKGRHILTTQIEHHAVLEPLETLAQQGYELEFIPVDCAGRVSLADVITRIRPETVLISVMHANNEIGTIQPIADIGALCRSFKVLFHTDAVQTFGKIPIDVRAMNIDLLSISAHKFYGPKGIGALYVRRGVNMACIQEGGGQERGRRGGTLNVPGIVGLGRAAELAVTILRDEAVRLTELREKFISNILESIPGIHITGCRTDRLPFNIHMCVEGIQGESILLSLDGAGIYASAASACSASSMVTSHVLKAIGMNPELARGSLRLTMGRSTTQEAMDYTCSTLVKVISELRSLS